LSPECDGLSATRHLMEKEVVMTVARSRPKSRTLLAPVACLQQRLA